MPIAMSDECKAIMEFLNCDYELHADEETLIERYDALAAQGRDDGFFPLIIIPSDPLTEMLDFAMQDQGAEHTPQGMEAYRDKIIEAAKDIDAAALLSKRLDESLGELAGYDILGQFEQAEPMTGFALYSLEGEAIIAKIPAKNPWELAAWLPMGGFNDCPSPAEQVAVFRYWHDRYGAIPALATYDIWELTVLKPALTDEAAFSLAKEQFAFCSDIVLQGAQTIGVLAGTLKHSTLWYFWWD